VIAGFRFIIPHWSVSNAQLLVKVISRMRKKELEGKSPLKGQKGSSYQFSCLKVSCYRIRRKESGQGLNKPSSYL